MSTAIRHSLVSVERGSGAAEGAAQQRVRGLPGADPAGVRHPGHVLTRRALTLVVARREVARYFGAKAGKDGLLPGPGAQLAETRLGDWLPANPPVR